MLDRVGECEDPAVAYRLGGLERVRECERRLKKLLEESYQLSPPTRGLVQPKLEQYLREVEHFLSEAERPRISVEAPGEAEPGEVVAIYVKNESPIGCTVAVSAGGGRWEVELRGYERARVAEVTVREDMKVVAEAVWSHGKRGRGEAVVKVKPKEERRSEPPEEEKDVGRTRGEEEPSEQHKQPAPPKAEPKPAEQPAPPRPELTAAALEEVFKHGLAAVVGYYLGRHRPAVRKVEKQVLVDPDVPHIQQGGVTYILADEWEVAVEDLGRYVKVRRTTPVEIMSRTTRAVAVKLLEDFRQKFLASYRSYKIEERRLSEDPPLFIIEAVEGRIFRKVKAVAVGYCRPQRLASWGVDHEPADLGQVVKELGLEEYVRGGVLMILASPTGWSLQSIEAAKRQSGVVLIDLKMGDVYRGDDPQAAEAAERLGYGQEEAAVLNTSERCDELLVGGSVDYATYLQLAREGRC